MRVEQRIGRIDRIGQRYPKIRVVNLAYRDTVEADVYFALGQRINLFEGLVGRLQPILSRLPKQFEAVTLEKQENRDAARHRLMADLEQTAREAENTTLDIDEVSADVLEMPKLPAPSMTLTELDQAFNHPGVLPPGYEWRRLDVGSYALRLPGMDHEVRVTTQAEVFDDHFESHLFLSPGGPLFEGIASQCLADGQPGKSESEGKVWLVSEPSGGLCRFLVRRDGQTAPCDSLGSLLKAIEDDAASGPLDASQLRSDEEASVLA
jgi:hypothetical protein